ncbi:hypothetical protein R3W88_007975 [Solanum pinnatisectum]|uniref:Uncharacterized protein n=1 Tax=Solanum pinnatisectum TaxID=50273 RepID=A0AAV9M9X9_9SOLN|nr:hypothetical protein R3W88_007975 [Solanum pinnatisectum]
MDNVCSIKRRDEEFKRMKEREDDKKNKTKAEQEINVQVQDNGKTEINIRSQLPQQMPPRRQDRHNEMQGQTQENIQITGQKQDSAIPQHSQHEQEINSKEAQWQTQKKKQNRNQEQASSKTMWRPVSPQHKSSKESNQQEAAASGILSTIQIHNNYTNLEVQEPQNMNQAEEGGNNRMLVKKPINTRVKQGPIHSEL